MGGGSGGGRGTSSTDGGGGTTLLFRVVLTTVMLVSGTLNTVSKSIQNQSTSKGLDHTSRKFSAPFFQSFCMFIGESLCLIAHWRTQRRMRRDLYGINGELAPDADYRALIPSGQLPEVVHEDVLLRGPRAPLWLFLVPACCDIAGTTLAGIGLLYVDASVWQMLRGSIIVFTAFASIVFLGQRKLPFHWAGLAVVVAGLGVVGASSLLRSKHEAASGSGAGSKNDVHKTVMGIVFIVAGQVCSAAQMVVEEIFLKKRNVPPLRAVGLEGCWGAVLMAVVVLPVCYLIPGHAEGGHYENALDAATMIGNNGSLLAFVLVYVLSIAFYNFSGLSVAKHLTSVHRTLIDALRTVFVWSMSLFIYYVVDKDFGEAWDTTYSFMQLGGFVLLFSGTLIYNRVVRLPGFRYSDPAERIVNGAPPPDAYAPLEDDN